MRTESRGKSSPYEVRCPRCDVSFPVETRTCIHCGGPTGEAGGFLVMDDPAELVAPIESSGVSTRPSSIDHGDMSTRPSSIEPERDSPFGDFGGNVFGDRGERDEASVDEYGDDRAYESEHGPPSFVQSLMRSMGSLIWIVILIAFSVSRSCGN